MNCVCVFPAAACLAYHRARSHYARPCFRSFFSSTYIDACPPVDGVRTLLSLSASSRHPSGLGSLLRASPRPFGYSRAPTSCTNRPSAAFSFVPPVSCLPRLSLWLTAREGISLSDEVVSSCLLSFLLFFAFFSVVENRSVFSPAFVAAVSYLANSVQSFDRRTTVSKFETTACIVIVSDKYRFGG